MISPTPMARKNDRKMVAERFGVRTRAVIRKSNRSVTFALHLPALIVAITEVV